MLIEVNEKVSKEAYELALGLKKFVVSIKQSLSDGWQPGSDLPVLLQAVILDLVPAINGIDKIPEEEKENLEAFVTAFLLPVKSLAFELLKKQGV